MFRKSNMKIKQHRGSKCFRGALLWCNGVVYGMRAGAEIRPTGYCLPCQREVPRNEAEGFVFESSHRKRSLRPYCHCVTFPLIGESPLTRRAYSVIDPQYNQTNRNYSSFIIHFQSSSSTPSAVLQKWMEKSFSYCG